jgi:translation initiation factor IF-1
MSKDDIIEAEGVVTEVLPSTTFRVKLTNGHFITAKLSGKMRMHYIKVTEGDNVTVEISPYNLNEGRISFRKK